MNRIEQAAIGVDGGGTGCRFLLRWPGRESSHEAGEGADEGARTEARADSGPANVSTDLDGALASLETGLTALARSAGLARAQLCDMRICFGLAGVLAPAPDIAGALGHRRAIVTDDQDIALTGALGAADGVVAGLGTGSYFGIQIAGQRRFAGGWGLRLGDEASGAWIGREMLRRTLAAEDGLRAHCAVSRRMRDTLGGPQGIVRFSIEASPADYAALARMLGPAEDPDATEILTRGAAHVADMLEALGWVAPMPICLLGSLGPVYAPYLPQRMQAHVTPPRASALEGALELARGL